MGGKWCNRDEMYYVPSKNNTLLLLSAKRVRKICFLPNFLQFSSCPRNSATYRSLTNDIIFHSGWLILHTTKSNLLSFLITSLSSSLSSVFLALHNGIKLRWDYGSSRVSPRASPRSRIRNKEETKKLPLFDLPSPLSFCIARYSFSISFSMGHRVPSRIYLYVFVYMCVCFTNILTFLYIYIKQYLSHVSKKFDSNFNL